jgi:hypothetical protein
MAQYILHELWDAFEGQLQGATVGDVAYAAQTFDERTHHMSTWTGTLGQVGWILYLFLLEQDAPVAHPTLRSRFSEMTIAALQGALDALVYHGLVHCHGRGRKRCYQTAGRMYRDWFLSAGKLSAPEQAEVPTTPAEFQILIKQLVQHIGAQTTITGGVEGPVASGQFQSAVTFGEGDAKDYRQNDPSEKDDDGG